MTEKIFWDFAKLSSLSALAEGETSNYAPWASRMELALTEVSLWPLVTGKSKKPTGATASAEWEGRDSKARMRIIMMIGDEDMNTVQRMESSSEIWTTLRAKHVVQGSQGVHQIIESLINLKIVDDDLPSFIASFTTLFNSGVASCDPHLVSGSSMYPFYFLRALPEEHKNYAAVLRQSHSKDGGLDGKTILTTSIIANALRDDGIFRKKVITKDSGGGALSVKTEGREGRTDGKKTCSACDKTGHVPADCWTLHPEKKRKFYAKMAKECLQEEEALARSVRLGETRKTIDLYWVVDGGASRHMTGDKSWFISYKPFSAEVTVADERKTPVIGIGDVAIDYYLDGELRSLVLRDVWHVPEFKVSLLSTFMAGKRGIAHGGDDKILELHLKSTKETILRAPIDPSSGQATFSCHKPPSSITSASLPTSSIFPSSTTAPSASPRSSPSLPVALSTRVDSVEIAHRKLGHPSVTTMLKLHSSGHLSGISTDEIKSFRNRICIPCLEGKSSAKPFPKSTTIASHPLSLLHADLQGPIPVMSRGGASYNLIITDDYSSYTWTYPLAKKSDAAEKFREFFLRVEKESQHEGWVVQTLRTDNGGEFTGESLQSQLKERGITHQTTIPHTSQQNGKGERKIRSVENFGATLLSDSKLSSNNWAEAAATATYHLNHFPSVNFPDRTPTEIYYPSRPRHPLNYFHIFGSRCLATKREPKAFGVKKIDCIFLGYGEAYGKKGYRVRPTSGGDVFHSRSLDFMSIKTCLQGYVEGFIEEEEVVEESEGEVEEELEESVVEEEEEEDDGSGDDADDAPAQPRQSTRQRTTPTHLKNYVSRLAAANSLEECAQAYARLVISQDFDGRPEPTVPRTDAEADASPYAKEWAAARELEMSSWKRNNVFRIVKRIPGARIVGCRWVYSLKRDEMGRVVRFKARLVAQGFTSIQGVDYKEKYAPVAGIASVRFFFAIIAYENLDDLQLDIKTAFLTAKLEEVVYLHSAYGYRSAPGEVWLLQRAVYGLPQSPRAFNRRLDRFFSTIDFHHIEADFCVYIGFRDGERLLLLLYVDDIKMGGKKELLLKIKKEIEAEFDIETLSGANLLGMKVDRDRDSKTVFLTQPAMIADILQRFNMESAPTADTPMTTNNPHLIPYTGPPINVPYLEALGCLTWLSTCCRPDISFAVGALGRFNQNPSREHWNAVKRIIMYLKGTPNFGIRFDGKSSAPIVEEFTDSDYAGDKDTRKSTTGVVIFVFGSPVVFFSRRQKAISTSTLEAEFIALSAGCRNVLWVHKFLIELGYPLPITPVHSDNQGALQVTIDGTHSEATKHIDIAHKYARSLHDSGAIELSYIPSKLNPADILTKPLAVERFEFCRELIGVVDYQG